MISGKTKVYGIIGNPVSHSKSPIIHNYWFCQHEIDAVYIPLPIDTNNVDQVIRILPSIGLSGVNVTIPYKEIGFRIVDFCDDFSAKSGALNTLKFTSDGKIFGMNTDIDGFLTHLYQTVPTWQAKAGPVMILGAGGAARAVLLALQKACVPEIYVVNRNFERAEKLILQCRMDKEDYHPSIFSISYERAQDFIGNVNLLVNATSLGMSGYQPLQFDIEKLPSSAPVYDIVYTPLDTDLLVAARKKNHPVVDGLGMLIGQARLSFQFWLGILPNVTEELTSFLLKK